MKLTNEEEIKVFELSAVFTMNFSYLRKYVTGESGMYVWREEVSESNRRIYENAFFCLQIAWKAWREGQAPRS